MARLLECRFVELDQRIEELSGMDSTQIHSMLGQSAYRRYEFAALRSLVGVAAERLVIAAPGSIVSETGETYSYLLANCFSVWIQASPEEHMSRVIAQGDMRPKMCRQSRGRMKDLRRILATREPLYARSGHCDQYFGQRTIDQTLEDLVNSIPSEK